MSEVIQEQKVEKNTSKRKSSPKVKKYFKKQFVESNLYTAIEKDILKIILEENLKYSKEEVKKKLETFKGKEVK